MGARKAQIVDNDRAMRLLIERASQEAQERLSVIVARTRYQCKRSMVDHALQTSYSDVVYRAP